MPHRPALLLALVLLGALARPSDAGPAAQSGARVRAALGEPSAERNLAFAGDLWEGAAWKGSVRVSVEAQQLDERMVWVSKEEVRWPGGASDRSLTVTLTLARDLTVERIELARREGPKELLAFLAREGDALSGTSRLITGEEEGAGVALRLPWPKATMGGLGAVVLLARAHAAPGQGDLEVDWIPTQIWTEAALPAVRTLTLGAPGAGSSSEPMLALKVAPALGGGGGSGTSVLRLDASSATVTGWTSLTGQADLLPIGRLPANDVFDEHKPAHCWQHAFRTFGVGYHMAVPALVDKAFNWQALYDYETSIEDGWPADRPLEAFKEAWLAQFMEQSQHRSRAETDALLAGTISTGALTVRTPDHVVLAAIAQFGGGEARTYQLRRGTDGVWRFTRFG